ncbi:Alpha/Beta hydrolase protein [Coniochaeta sp. 2T2.1]|nr:Alpha/Beta hydrolase protein [Coniochaeta sp. 2T2.1]
MTTTNPFGTVPEGAPGKPTPFTLHIPDEELSHFHQLLSLSKIAPPTYENLKGGKHDLGVHRDWIVSAKDAWLNSFNWREHEALINSFPNFKIPIADEQCGTLDIHFIGLFSAREDAVPVIFMHGWPGSFGEFLPMLGLLVVKYTPETLPYHVIVPSLPGYVLSGGPPTDRDFSSNDAARYMNSLMVQLGFGMRGYVAQGGDVGYFLTRIMSATFEECRATHVNFLLLSGPDAITSTEGLTEDDILLLEGEKTWRTTGFGYALVQGTKPATIGLALSSSPLAILPWVAEKFIDESDEPLPLDVVLRMASLYWFTESFPRGIYPYRSLMRVSDLTFAPGKPLGYSHFRREVCFLPKAWEFKYPGLKWRRDHDKGGHFAALEQPELFLADVEEFVLNVVGPL